MGTPLLVHLAMNLGTRTSRTMPVEASRGAENKYIAGGEGSREVEGVGNVWQDANVHVGHCDNPRRSGSYS